MGAHRLKYNDRDFLVKVQKNAEGFFVTVDETTFQATVTKGLIHLDSENRQTPARALIARDDSRIFVELNGRLLEIDLQTDETSGAGDHSHAGEKDKLYAPMPGRVVKIMVSEGDKVKARQALAVVEAMKMENQLLSPADGTVKKINFSAGDQVDTEKPIIELEVQ